MSSKQREVATKERKKLPVLCPNLKFLVCGDCRESVNPPQLNIQEVQGALSSRPKGDPGRLPIFQDCLTLSNHTPGVYSLLDVLSRTGMSIATSILVCFCISSLCDIFFKVQCWLVKTRLSIGR